MQIFRSQDRPIKSEVLMVRSGKMIFSQALQAILMYAQVWVSYSLPLGGESVKSWLPTSPTCLGYQLGGHNAAALEPQQWFSALPLSLHDR